MCELTLVLTVTLTPQGYRPNRWYCFSLYVFESISRCQWWRRDAGECQGQPSKSARFIVVLLALLPLGDVQCTRERMPAVSHTWHPFETPMSMIHTFPTGSDTTGSSQILHEFLGLLLLFCSQGCHRPGSPRTFVFDAPRAGSR